MPDLFDPLRGTPDQLVRPPLPAEEVRRRGDRLRRRRTATAATGAALAVALVVGGGLTLGGGLTSGSAPAPVPPAGQSPSGTADPAPTPAPGPDVDWRTTIPAGFPLADDLGEPVSTEEELAGPGRDVRVFDVPFAACGHGADLGAPADSLSVRYTQPEWFDGRVLQVYDDAAAARQVLERLVAVYADCPEDVVEGPPDGVATAAVRPVPLGEEGYLVTRTFDTDGLRTTGLELLHLVRVGNALLVSNLSNEGGADDASVARSLGEREPVVADVAGAMCVFAATGCGRDEDGSSLGAAVLGVDELRELTRDLRTSWTVVQDRRPTLSCQPVELTTLEPTETASTFFDGTGSTAVVNAQAAGTVLQLPDVALAEQAFATVAGWLRECGDPGSAARPVAIAHETVTQRTGWGPATWRVVERPAPEICTECDTGWIDAQGVVLVGDRLALVSVAYTGDMGSGADTAASPMNDAVEAVARLAADGAGPSGPPVFGPRGLGSIHLGMSAADVESSGAVLEDSHGQGCTTFTATPDGVARVFGFLAENQGVSVLLVDEQGVLTPAGVGIGTTEKRVRAAYPDVEDVPMGLIAPVPGFPNREYTFAFEDGRLVEMALRLTRQPCVG